MRRFYLTLFRDSPAAIHVVLCSSISASNDLIPRPLTTLPCGLQSGDTLRGLDNLHSFRRWSKIAPKNIIGVRFQTVLELTAAGDTRHVVHLSSKRFNLVENRHTNRTSPLKLSRGKPSTGKTVVIFLLKRTSTAVPFPPGFDGQISDQSAKETLPNLGRSH